MKNYTVKDIERFWKYVVVSSSEECWEWVGAHFGSGRPSFKYNCKPMLAYRFSFWIHTGHWPGGLCVCHSCDNFNCVNPKHLWLGTQKDNIHDATIKGHRATKLTENEVRKIRGQYDAGDITMAKLAEEYNVCPATVCLIVNNKRWKHIIRKE